MNKGILLLKSPPLQIRVQNQFYQILKSTEKYGIYKIHVRFYCLQKRRIYPQKWRKVEKSGFLFLV